MSSLARTLGWAGIFRLALVQTALGSIIVLTTSTMNRVMVVELALPALVPGVLVALHHVVQLLRPRLGQNLPNPFNPQTTVDFALASSERVRIAIYDVRGTLVKRLVDETMPAGEHHATWNGIDDAGRPTASGIYFVRMIAGGYEQTRKIVMLK